MKYTDLVKYIKSVTKQEQIDFLVSKDIIEIVEDSFNYLKRDLKRGELSRFLYYICHQFNRFSIPTNYYHYDDDINYFERCLKLFEKIEKNFLDNILTLKVDFITWEFLTQVKRNKKINYDNYLNSIDRLYKYHSQLPTTKKEEFIEHYDRCVNLIQGVKKNEIYTVVSCLIPITPVKNTKTFRVEYDNKPVEIKLIPKSQENPIFSSDENSLISFANNSNWQLSYCIVNVTITGYIDLLVAEKKLYLGSYDNPNYLDLKIYNYLYELLSSIFWHLKATDTTINSKWLIQPIDIEQVTHKILSNKKEYGWIHYPIKTAYVTNNIKKEEVKKISVEKKVLWHIRCLLLAKEYLSMGNSQLSLFWLNVGIEAFLKYRISEICKKNNLNEESLFAESYFDRTKRELEKLNDKEVLKGIRWPKQELIHLSMFRKLKILSSKNLFKEKKKIILKKYSTISRHRNIVFHGDTDEPIEILTIKEAIDSYEWLLKNL